MKKSFNVDIYFDFAMSVQVEAESLEEAVAIVEERIENGVIKPTEAEATGDYELDTDYQPE